MDKTIIINMDAGDEFTPLSDFTLVNNIYAPFIPLPHLEYRLCFLVKPPRFKVGFNNNCDFLKGLNWVKGLSGIIVCAAGHRENILHPLRKRNVIQICTIKKHLPVYPFIYSVRRGNRKRSGERCKLMGL